MSNRTDKVSRIQVQIDQMQVRLKDAKAQEKKRLRKEHDRKTYIHGGAFLAAVAKASPEKRRKLELFIDKYITRSTDRSFLGLDPLAEPAERSTISAADEGSDPQLPLNFERSGKKIV